MLAGALQYAIDKGGALAAQIGSDHTIAPMIIARLHLAPNTVVTPAQKAPALPVIKAPPPITPPPSAPAA